MCHLRISLQKGLSASQISGRHAFLEVAKRCRELNLLLHEYMAYSSTIVRGLFVQLRCLLVLLEMVSAPS